MKTTPSTNIDQDGSGLVLATGEHDVVRREILTVKVLAEKLAAIETKFGYEHALLCMETLSYPGLASLVDRGGPDNDPHLMPSRFCILYGATDKGLEAKGNLDPFGPKDAQLRKDYEMKVPHVMSVQSLGDLLCFIGAGGLGHVLPEWGKDPSEPAASGQEKPRVFTELDDELFEAMHEYLERLAMPPLPEHALPETHEFQPGESLTSIAELYGIRNWRLLRELNRDQLKTWDCLDACCPDGKGMTLKLPDPTQDPLGEGDSFRAWLDGFANGHEVASGDGTAGCSARGYQYPGRYLSLTLMEPDGKMIATMRDEQGKEASEPFSVHLRRPGMPLVHHVSIAKGDEIDFVVPDTPELGWGLKGNPLVGYDVVRCYYKEDVLVDEEEGAALEREIPPVAKPIRDQLNRNAKREEEA